MKKAVFLVLALVVFSANAFAQNVPTGFDISNYGVRIEPDKRVIVVLAALDAARTTNQAGEQVPVLNVPLSAEGAKFRGDVLHSDLAALKPELRQRISTFVINYKSRNSGKTDAEIIAPFISMAYALTPAPELADPVVTSDLPGSLLDVLDFAPLVRDFYRGSSISANIDDYVKRYRTASDAQLRSTAREMVSDLLSYLHTRPQIYYAEKISTEGPKAGSKKSTIRQTETRERERRFFIVPEMLAPVGTVNFLNVRVHIFVYLPPDTDVTFSEARRGFLQFVIDPIVLNNAKDIATIRDSVKKLLDERQKAGGNVSPDVYLTISRSLVAAVDAKQSENLKIRLATQQSREKIDRVKTVDEKKAVSAELEKYKQTVTDETALRMSEDYEKGSILVFYFADQLKGVEDSGFDIASSMREMILSFDPAKETDRLAPFAEARKRALAAREERKNNPGSVMIAENPVTTRLIEIQKTIDAKNYTQANADLKQLLDKNPGEARIYYNLGRVASLSAQEITEPAAQNSKLLEAKVAYENVLRIAEKQRVDPALLSLSYVALAKIYEFYDENSYAAAVYDAAIKIGPVTGGAFKEALDAKARLVKEQ